MSEKKSEETGPVEVPAASQMGATFAERAKAREQVEAKQVDAEVDEVEDKAISKAATKRAPKKS